MNHNVLHIGEFLFHALMNLFGYFMSLPQRFLSVYLNFQINVDLVPKHSGTQQVHADYAVLGGHIVANRRS